MKHAPILLFVLAGCSGHTMHHQYDHGRAYSEAFEQQADTSRESAQGYEFELSGTEGLELRARVVEATTDEADSDTVEETE
jgi:hypothetical protein